MTVTKSTAPAAPTAPTAVVAFSPDDEKWMTAALERGARGAPSPNPHVGAVVVKDGQLVGSGHHERAGESHAEVVALTEAGGRAPGATLYVTLEPCNHTGRTPPCTDAIIRAKIARVVVGCPDPNPHVEGGGLETLRKAGIKVDVGCREADARKLIAPWTKFVTTGVPHIALKLALSLDGRIASRTGASKWVTGPEARARVHQLRSMHDAVLIGIGTALADDPRLTVRDAPGHSPLRVVLDTKLRLPLASRLVQTAREVPTWVVCTTDAPTSLEEALTERGVEVLRAPPSAEGRVDPMAALKILASRGIVTVMIEGGAELAGSVFAGAIVDELHCFVAPILLGPRGRPGAVDWAGPATPAEAPSIGQPQWEVCGVDAHVWGPVVYPPEVDLRLRPVAWPSSSGSHSVPQLPQQCPAANLARGRRRHYIANRIMAVRTILHYPDARLREAGRKVERFTDEIRKLVDDMAETMYAAPGVGLAATQIGELWQVFVVDCAAEGEPSDLRVFINPEIIASDGTTTFDEGCLSFPGAREEVERAATVRVRAQDRDGKFFELEADGLLAIAIQHESDHLRGVLMIDHLGPLKKRLLHRKMLRRETSATA